VSVLPDIDQRIAELEALDCGVLLEQLDLSAAIDGVRRNAAEYTGESETELDAEYQWLLIARWLRELRARRIAMGRDPGDERNATADLACPGCGDIMGECGCVQAAEEMEAFESVTGLLLCRCCGAVDCICEDDGLTPDGMPF